MLPCGVVWLFAAAMVLLLGGFGLGFAFAKRTRVLLAALGLPALLVVARVLYPSGQAVQCRLGGGFWGSDEHPPELVGAWVGWDTSYPTPCCRLELAGDGTGRCAMWYRERETGIWRVLRWSVSGDQIFVSLEAGERREQMHGRVFAGALSLMYFGSDNPELTKNWFGPLHLVPESTETEAMQAMRRALETR